MHIGGHPPGLDPDLEPKVCVPCKANDHRHCRPFVQHARQQLLYCECLGWEKRGLDLIILPCLKEIR